MTAYDKKSVQTSIVKQKRWNGCHEDMFFQFHIILCYLLFDNIDFNVFYCFEDIFKI